MRFSTFAAPLISLAAAFTLLPGTAHADSTTTGATTETAAVSTQGAGSTIRFATFNVRTSRADLGTSRHWLRRASSVARQIKTTHPDVVALQELGPGRADGKVAKINGAARQTESLLRALRSAGAGQYRLVRTTAYARPGSKHGTQGARILYNSKRVRLLSRCAQTTGKLAYNRSCSIDLPRLKGESATQTRSAAYARFQDLRTKKTFYVVSVHLDDRHSGKASTEHKLQALRAAQVRTAYTKVAKLAHGAPIFFGGDLNSWRTKSGGSAPHNYLKKQGFKDAAYASSKAGARYPTVNHFRRTLKANAPGRQVALDVVMVRRGKGFSHYANVTKVVDANRPSDHNLVLGDVRL